MTRLGRLEFALVLTLGVALMDLGGCDSSPVLATRGPPAATDRRPAISARAAGGPPPTRSSEGSCRSREPAPPGDNHAALAHRDATIEQLNRELSEAQANVMGLRRNF